MTQQQTDCSLCGGKGLTKIFWLRQWMAVECSRCEGTGVDPTALPKSAVVGEYVREEKK